MIRSDRKWCNFFPFKAEKPTVLNIQWDAFSTNKSGVAALIDEVEASRENQDVFRESAQKHQNSPLSGYQTLKQHIYLDSMLHSTITEPGCTDQQFC